MGGGAIGGAIGAHGEVLSQKSARAGAGTWTLAAGVSTAVVALLLLFWRAAASGPWLDEFFSLYATDPARSFDRLWSEVLIQDNHPPLYNLGFWALRQGIDLGFLEARLFNLIAVAAFLGYWASRVIAWPGERLALSILLILALSAQPLHAEIGNFRAYTSALVAGLFLALGTRGLLEPPTGKVRLLDVVAFVAGAGLMANLHYFAALMAGLVVAGTLAALALQGRRRLAVRLALACALAAAPAVLFALAQAEVLASRTGGAFWIDHTLPYGGRVLLTGLVMALGVNLATGALALLALGHAVAQGPSPGKLARALGPSALVLAGAVGAFSLVLLLVSLHTPVILERYLVVFVGPAGVTVAWLAARAAERRSWLVWAAAANAAAFMAVDAARDWAEIPRWSAGAQLVASLEVACPARPVYAALMDISDGRSLVEAGMPINQILALGYRQAGHAQGFRPELLASGMEPRADPDCGAVYWFEHLSEHVGDTSPKTWFLNRSLTPPREARISAFRTPTGGVVLAEPCEAGACDVSALLAGGPIQPSGREPPPGAGEAPHG